MVLLSSTLRSVLDPNSFTRSLQAERVRLDSV